MASIEDQIRNARTIEDIVNLLSILFTNLNNQNEIYYDMFLNPEKMYIDLERYNENGVLETVPVPNVAMMRQIAYVGDGDPNGVQPAPVGSLYVDNISKNIYYKAEGSDTSGWIEIFSPNNFIANTSYLTPTGNASQLNNLNMNQATAGTLKVECGGTGVNEITGIIKGRGSESFTAATAGTDYLAPIEFTGLIMYCPMEAIPDKWLICDGESYLKTEYAALYSKIGDRYKKAGDDEDTFRVPNLIDKYIKGGLPVNVGTTGEAHVGEHKHRVTGNTANENQHVHDKGTMQITGMLPAGEVGLFTEAFKKYIKDNSLTYGCFTSPSPDKPTTKNPSWRNVCSGQSVNDKFDNDMWKFDARRTWTGTTGKTSHLHSINIDSQNAGEGTNDVDHVVMVPIIRT